jgi:hypothetical protein
MRDAVDAFVAYRTVVLHDPLALLLVAGDPSPRFRCERAALSVDDRGRLVTGGDGTVHWLTVGADVPAALGTIFRLVEAWAARG